MQRKHFHRSQTAVARGTPLALAIVLAWSGTPALAQDAAPNPVAATAPAETAPGEIVVTATRRAETLSKVPQSVTALSQASLDARGIKDISGVVRQTPGIQFDPNGFGNQTNIAIRGVSSTVGAATTGVYIDDTPIQSRVVGYSTTNAFPAVFDLARVEVLRGPQGTLFGAGSEGGTVRFITTQPSLTDTRIYGRAEAAATQGGAASGELGVSVTAPLIKDKLGIAASVWYRHDGGWIDRQNANPVVTNAPYLKNVNSSWTQVARVALKWAPVDGVEVTPSLYYQKRVNADTSPWWESQSDASKGKYVSGAPNGSPDRDRFYMPALNISANLGGVQLISNTSYYVRDQSGEIDYSTIWPAVFVGSPWVGTDHKALAYMRNDQRTFTQEVRLQSADSNAALTWVLGGFYAKSVQHFGEQVYDPNFADIFGGVPPEVVLGTPLVDGKYSLAGDGRGADAQIAGFAEGSLKLTDTLKVTAGVRVAHTRFEGNSLFQGPVSGYQLQNNQSVSENPVTPKFALNWQATPTTLLYATAAKGYRIGGTNAPVPLSQCGADLTGFGFADVPATYKSDSLWSYEAGAKTRVGGVSLAASAYHVDWSNIQQNVYLQHCGAQFTANLGKARSQGFDLQATARVAPGFTLDGTVAYTNARLTQNVSGLANPAPGYLIAAVGDHLETHPWTATLGASYETSLGAATGYLRADYQYKSKAKMAALTDPRASGYDPGAYPLPQVHYASLRAGVRHGVYDLSVFVDNLTNETTILSRSIEVAGVGTYRNLSQRPRTFGLTLVMRQ
ncbi:MULTISPECIES: TonB-dependent receptor [unclassified Novosphingobium]|uniref:TonB-dependent receptor n=1 Tax=unclassified Novosphingobium TaxID=2644732 RepID=UPI00146AE6B8|nr:MULTISPECIES: TonB-dependent receptor [unclassified Novosphingobium]NMN05524.1 outer membrane receptor protein involved in Fe transport [Novosphingobium sp. SG919]NMN88117.1 outer membrane receptor protein involved in Fe transport [Novosphingobium sp. SG916]